MRNTIKVLDPSFPRVTISTISSGEMFQYKDRRYEDAVYMKLNANGVGINRAVHLPTGEVYEISTEVLLCRVSLLQIGSSI